MSRRRSSIVQGIEDAERELLGDHDQSFYGADDLSDSSDAEEHVMPPAKRVDDGDEDENFSSDDEATAQPAAEIREALLESQWRDAVSAGCKCQECNHFQKLSQPDVIELMTSVQALSKRELQVHVLGILSACLLPSATDAARRRFNYSVLGRVVCKNVFMEVYGVTNFVIKKLQAIAESHSAVVPKHASAESTKEWISVPPDIVDNVVKFLRNYASVYGLPQPAALRGRPNAPPIFLPASVRKNKIFEEFTKSLLESGDGRTISYSSFHRIWKHHTPEIQVMKPRTDVCAVCDRLRERLRRCRTEEQISESTEQLRDHVSLAQAERDYYNHCIEHSRSTSNPPNAHITFDFAQQLELPAHTRQVGPLYFKVRYRVQLFGICNEALKQQDNYLFDEASTIGEDGKKAHGPNTVISMLHDYLDDHDVPRTLHFHADNCVGQNKNKSVLAYFAWRIMCGLSDDITLSFMRVGHTRCAVDGYFGLLKQQFRKSDVDTLEDVKFAVAASCKANVPVMASWEWYKWDAFLLDHFMPVKGIRNYQHFRFAKSRPGHVFARRKCTDDAEDDITLARNPDEVFDRQRLPEILPAAGLSDARLAYCDKQLAEYTNLEEGETYPWVHADE